MAFRDTWHRALVYFGLAVEHDYDDEPEYDRAPERSGRETASVSGSSTPSPRSTSRTSTESARTCAG